VKSAEPSAPSAVGKAIRSLLLLLLLAPRLLLSQERGAAALHGLVNGLGNSARVLMIGAHPDDEDTNLIAWLARGRNVETAYLSLTRGDGGQNLIGNELGVALGVIRTEELLAARRIDGGRQFFTRAYDFGFSKSAEETFRHWPRDELLRDVVTVVRAFRPHVIVSVFSGTPRDGHGHHQVAGMLARDAFDMAGDTVAMSAAATRGASGWTPLKFYRAQRGNAQGATVGVNAGEYDPVLGRSYAEIAGLSRSQHRSQGFGALQRRGPVMNYVRLEASRVGEVGGAERSMFDGIDTSWKRFASVPMPADARASLDSIPLLAARIREAVDLRDPDGIVPDLSRYTELNRRVFARLSQCADGEPGCAGAARVCANAPLVLCGGMMGDLLISLRADWRRALSALEIAAGVSIDGLAPRAWAAEGDSIEVAVELFNQGRRDLPVQRMAAYLLGDHASVDTAFVLRPDSAARRTFRSTVGGRDEPWWTRAGRTGDMFDAHHPPPPAGPVSTMAMIPLLAGEAPPSIVGPRVGALATIAGTEMGISSPVVHRFVDPVLGEQRHPLEVLLPVSVVLENEVEYVKARTPLDRQLRVQLRSAMSDTQRVTVTLDRTAGLRVEPPFFELALPPGSRHTVTFRLRGSLWRGDHSLLAAAAIPLARYGEGYIEIDYPHIQPRRIYRPSSVRLSAVDINVPAGLTVGYIPGVGDNVPSALRQLEIPVTIIEADALADADLSRFTTVVVGPRAFEANESLRRAAGRLLDFARDGGRVVAQFGQYEMQQPGILPYPITINRPHDRVTEEDSPVTMTAPQARVLTTPNRITTADFEGWVQERSVYMPRTFDERYESVLEMNDPGETPNRGGILVARVGRGSYVYTTLSFFRQLPAGNPGAARLFVNLLTPEGMR
jgi:LmbE family N-acetylglucosaminyl deacetylase